MANEIIDKIAKLIRHQESAHGIGNTAEAEAFAAKAQELMLKHKLEMSDIEAADLEKHEPIESEYITGPDLVGYPLLNKFRKQNWIGILLYGLDRANFCRSVTSGSSTWGYYIIGRKSDREALKTTIRYLYDACLDVVKREAKTYRQSDNFAVHLMRGKQSASLLSRFRSSFKVGFASAIQRRVKSEQQNLLKGVNETGLIKLDGIRAQVDEAVSRQFPKLRNSRSVVSSSTDGHSAGYRYGSSVGINSTKRLSAAAA